VVETLKVACDMACVANKNLKTYLVSKLRINDMQRLGRLMRTRGQRGEIGDVLSF
jgi:hypothetical protein